jgi:hypothetical protein
MSKADWDKASSTAMELFAFGQQEALTRGLFLVDTKYEFGKDKYGNVLLIDEIHTPDSSRYWIEESYGARHSAGKVYCHPLVGGRSNIAGVLGRFAFCFSGCGTQQTETLMDLPPASSSTLPLRDVAISGTVPTAGVSVFSVSVEGTACSTPRWSGSSSTT